jgi:hypothetical protein
VPPIVSAPRAPYALEPTAFSFPALAAMAGRSNLGGPRELALACFLVGRIVRGAMVGHESLTPEQLKHRSQAVKHWLGAAAIQPNIRLALSRLADVTASGDSAAVKAALDGVMAVTANHLDSGARSELGRLAQTIAE